MTLNQLFNEVYALGFDAADELNESFIFSVNRALKMIFTELTPSVRAKIFVDRDADKTIDLLKRIDNVMIITSAPLNSLGQIIKGAYTDGYILTLPEDFSGDVFIKYKPLPREFTLNDGESKIDVPPFASHLVPILTASFVFLDDDEEKADYYMTMYRHEVLKINHQHAMSKDNTYTDVTGWA